jgi:hypothetical protein
VLLQLGSVELKQFTVVVGQRTADCLGHCLNQNNVLYPVPADCNTYRIRCIRHVSFLDSPLKSVDFRFSIRLILVVADKRVILKIRANVLSIL